MSLQTTDLMSVREAARVTGTSRSTVYRLIERGRLPATLHPITGRVQLLRSDVLRLLNASERGRDPSSSTRPRSGEASYQNGLSHASSSNERSGSEREGVEPARPPEWVDSVFRLHELALDFGVADLSERVDHYRAHGLPSDEKDLSGHVGAHRGEHSD